MLLMKQVAEIAEAAAAKEGKKTPLLQESEVDFEMDIEAPAPALASRTAVAPAVSRAVLLHPPPVVSVVPAPLIDDGPVPTPIVPAVLTHVVPPVPTSVISPTAVAISDSIDSAAIAERNETIPETGIVPVVVPAVPSCPVPCRPLVSPTVAGCLERLLNLNAMRHEGVLGEVLSPSAPRPESEAHSAPTSHRPCSSSANSYG